jgi:hypothetical protein
MRDTHATGTGSIMGAGTAGYCVGNLRLDGAPLPHEDPAFVYPDNLAPPLQVTGACPRLGLPLAACACLAGAGLHGRVVQGPSRLR